MTYVTQQLKNSVVCPVCLSVPTEIPIFIYPNGHNICSKCKRNLCSICITTMGRMRNRITDIVINMIDHEYSHDSCAEQIPLSELMLHEAGCQTNPVFCPAVSCSKYVRMSLYMDHLHLGVFVVSFVVVKGVNKQEL